MSIEIIVNDPALKGGACRCLLPSRPRVWPVDSGPTGNVARSDGVGRPREATPDAPKGGWVRTIALIDQSTVGTGARGIARIDHDGRDPGQLRLVRDKLPHAIDRMPHYGGDAAPRVLGLRHQLFGNAVVLVRGKALFLVNDAA